MVEGRRFGGGLLLLVAVALRAANGPNQILSYGHVSVVRPGEHQEIGTSWCSPRMHLTTNVYALPQFGVGRLC